MIDFCGTSQRLHLNIETPVNILVRRRAALGDVVMVTGVIRELKNKYKCNVDIATEFGAVFQNNPHIRNLYHTDSMPRISDYDLYFNLDNAYELNPLNNYLDSYFYRVFGSSNLFNKPELYVNDNDINVVSKFIGDNDLNKFIVVHMRNWYWPLKNMSLDTWFEVYEKLFTERADFKVVVIGSAQDHSIEHPLFVDGRTVLSIQQQKLLLDEASCFVGTDSGPYHIAAASGTNIVSLHTHLLPERIVPSHNWVTPILSKVDCVGCNDTQQRPVSHIICKHNDYRCSNNFDSQEIATAILHYL